MFRNGCHWDLPAYWTERGLTTRTVQSFDVMHHADGTWKLTNRWAFTGTTAC